MISRDNLKFLALVLFVFGASCLFAACAFLPGCAVQVEDPPELQFPFVAHYSDGGQDADPDGGAADPPACPWGVGEGDLCPAAIPLVCRDGECVLP